MDATEGGLQESAPEEGEGLGAERRRWRRLVDLLASLLVLAIFAGLTVGVIMYFRAMLQHDELRRSEHLADPGFPRSAARTGKAEEEGGFRPVPGAVAADAPEEGVRPEAAERPSAPPLPGPAGSEEEARIVQEAPAAGPAGKGMPSDPPVPAPSPSGTGGTSGQAAPSPSSPPPEPEEVPAANPGRPEAAPVGKETGDPAGQSAEPAAPFAAFPVAPTPSAPVVPAPPRYGPPAYPGRPWGWGPPAYRPPFGGPAYGDPRSVPQRR